MVDPFLQPQLPPDSPDNGIVFHQVAGIRIQRGQTGAQVTQHIALIEAGQRRLQSIDHRGNHIFLQNILRAGLIHRDMEPVENQADQGQIDTGVGEYHGNIPVSAAASHQLQNLLGSRHALHIRSLGTVGLQHAPGKAGSDGPLKQLFPQLR